MPVPSFDVSSIIRKTGVIPLFSRNDPKKNDAAIRACVAAADRAAIDQFVFEFTCRFKGWATELARLAQFAASEFPGRVCFGAGSCFLPQAVAVMKACGAYYIVSPRRSRKMMRSARMANIPCVPAASGANDFYEAYLLHGRRGGFVKFFPSKGGPDLLEEILEPMGECDFFGDGKVIYPPAEIIPTGLPRDAIDHPDQWLKVKKPSGSVVALGASKAVFDPKEVEEDNWEPIIGRLADFFIAVKKFKS